MPRLFPILPGATFPGMNLDQLVTEATSLPQEQRKALISRLLALGRVEREAEFRHMLAQKIDDQNPQNWVPMEELARHLRLDTETE